MKITKDSFFYWIESSFGNIRFQHNKEIIEAVDDGRLKWSIGKTVKEVCNWIEKREKSKLDMAIEVFNKLLNKEQGRKILYAEEEQRRREWMEKEFGDKELKNYENNN